VSGFDATLWWIDLRAVPRIAAKLFLATAGFCLLVYALWPVQNRWWQRLTLVTVGIAMFVAGLNAGQFWFLLAHTTFRAGTPIPLSLFVACALGLVLKSVWRQDFKPLDHRDWFFGAGAFLACVIGFPVLQALCFGKTDYRRPADAAIVFGARAYVDGRPSDALADRVRTACQLYRDGTVRRLIFSGGPGDGATHETEAMQRMALHLGVSASDILVDVKGLNTAATVENTKDIFTRIRAKRILAVSHFYHLPRIKMAYQRAGWDVYTVPARETYFLREIPYMVAREVAAFWAYYLQPLSGRSFRARTTTSEALERGPFPLVE